MCDWRKLLRRRFKFRRALGLAFVEPALQVVDSPLHLCDQLILLPLTGLAVERGLGGGVGARGGTEQNGQQQHPLLLKMSATLRTPALRVRGQGDPGAIRPH
jgi:hypothetical protein